MKNRNLVILFLTLSLFSLSTVVAEQVTSGTKYVTRQSSNQQNTQNKTLGTISRKSVTPEGVKTNITKYNQLLTKQASVDYNNLFKSQSLNKTQRAIFTKHTQSYITSLNVGRQTMSFYLEDIEDIINSTDTDENKSKLSADIMSRATLDYRETVFITNDYLKNCSYAMPTLTYQKFLKAFQENYYLDNLDLSKFTTMK